MHRNRPALRHVTATGRNFSDERNSTFPQFRSKITARSGVRWNGAFHAIEGPGMAIGQSGPEIEAIGPK
jgi:hypothetical protein